MKIKQYFVIVVLLFAVIIGHGGALYGQDNSKNKHNLNSKEIVEKILDGIEKRYSVPGFSAEFTQESTLKAMDIVDTAAGNLKVRHPGMMRWEYVSPDPQIIVTDGDRLWIYRPEDNQVMVGNAPAFFKDGKGAGFLSDMKLLRAKFTVFLETTEMTGDEDYQLKLFPEDQSLELASIILVVDPQTYVIKNIVTYNAYEDETRIRMSNYNFDIKYDDDMFNFTIPKGVDILEME
jgi:outer membrane lipoprotein carrier protein